MGERLDDDGMIPEDLDKENLIQRGNKDEMVVWLNYLDFGWKIKFNKL